MSVFHSVSASMMGDEGGRGLALQADSSTVAGGWTSSCALLALASAFALPFPPLPRVPLYPLLSSGCSMKHLSKLCPALLHLVQKYPFPGPRFGVGVAFAARAEDDAVMVDRLTSSFLNASVTFARSILSIMRTDEVNESYSPSPKPVIAEWMHISSITSFTVSVVAMSALRLLPAVLTRVIKSESDSVFSLWMARRACIA